MSQTHAVTPETGKEPFDIDAVFERLRRAVADLPKAAMFDLRDRGYGSPFEQLVGSLISARTRDETTVEVCLRLFAEARTPRRLRRPSRRQAGRLARWGHVPGAQGPRPEGDRPPDHRRARRQGARLACRADRVSRASAPRSRRSPWRSVSAAPPSRSMSMSTGSPTAGATSPPPAPSAPCWRWKRCFPERYWIEINERLVPFGKFVCTAVRPKCSTCLLLSMCRQVGVVNPR